MNTKCMSEILTELGHSKRMKLNDTECDTRIWINKKWNGRTVRGWRVMKWLLQLLCIHEWEKKKFVDEYHDYGGFKVGLFRCKCKKCGKIKLKKYW